MTQKFVKPIYSRFDKSLFIDKGEPEIIYEGPAKQKNPRVQLKVKKLVKCKQCQKVFYERADLEKHINNDHKKHWKAFLPNSILKNMQKKLVNCGQCERVFYEKADLEIHINNDHEEALESFPGQTNTEDDAIVPLDKSSEQEAQTESGVKCN